MAAKKDTKEPKREREELPPLWALYRVRLTFLTRICSSTPADPEIVLKWIETREPRVKPAGALSIEEINEEVLASIARGEGEADQTYSLLVFQRAHAPFRQIDTGGDLAMRLGTVRAHIKDCSRVLSAQYIGKIDKERAFSTRVVNAVYYDERVYWLPIRREDGAPVREPDGAFDKAVRAYVPGRGQMSALKRIEYVDPGAVLEFTLKVLGKSVSETDLHHIFTYGGVHGYGGERGDGEGRYTYELKRIESEGAAHSDVRGTHAHV